MLRVLNRAAELTGLRRQWPADGELTVTLVGARAMAEVNRRYLGHEGATDVITFDYRPAAGEAVGGDGEVLVCVDVAAEAAAAHGTGVGWEVVLYAVHGMLHLAGCDDREPLARKRMRRAERRVMDGLVGEFALEDLFAVSSAGAASPA